MNATMNTSDPLPQALILTAIVIGLGVTAFALVLVYRFYKETNTVDLDQLSETE
jgi:multicomponent Na+:H+ antiporter subunit C